MPQRRKGLSGLLRSAAGKSQHQSPLTLIDVPRIDGFSAGVSRWQPGEHRNALLRRADGWLNEAKAGGRDGVCNDQNTPS